MYVFMPGKNYNYQVWSIHPTLEEAKEYLLSHGQEFMDADHLFIMKAEYNELLVYPNSGEKAWSYACKINWDDFDEDDPNRYEELVWSGDFPFDTI